MRNKILLAILLTAFLVLFASGFFIVRILYKNFERSIYANLKTESNILAQEIMYDKKILYESNNQHIGTIRITLIDRNGSILYDSNYTPNEMENHLYRSEIQDALKKGEGTSSRLSDTLKERFYYYAKKLPDGKILRIATSQNTVKEVFLQNLDVIIIFVLMLLCILLLISYFLARNIVNPINNIDVENIDLEHEEKILNYIEIKPLLKKIAEQKQQLENDKAKLKRAELIRKDFTANVSHELKTPLQAISGYAELLKSGIVQEKDIQPFAEKIFTESLRMHNLVDDIINLTELESPEKEIQFQLTDFVAVCENVIDSLSSIAEKKSVTITFDYNTDENYRIFSVPEMLHTIIYNLIDNAIKYNKCGGRIFVALEIEYTNGKNIPDSTKRICVRIRDTGIGIESEYLPRIFERFFRVDKSRSNIVGGTGLGLSIVKHSIALLHAEVSVKSQLGEGTEFSVLF